MTAEALSRAYGGWRRRERRFNLMIKGKKQYSESEIDETARAAEEAFALTHSLLRAVTGAKLHQDCAAMLPDGSLLLFVTEPATSNREKSTKLTLIPPHRIVRLP